jgi:predicted DCC family thiol-disulfide oxidoreductase YuxK
MWNMRTPSPAAPHAVVLFDGVCNLCNGGVNYIIDHDPAGYFRFASQQSAAGRELMRRHGVVDAATKTVMLIEQGNCYTRSSALLRIARHLGAGGRLLALLGAAIPPVLLDWIYDWIAGNRYRWFGRADACRLPGPGRANRFVESV